MTDRVPTLSKEQVHYRAGTAERHCGNCDMFHADGLGIGHCDLVKGVIELHRVCDRWEALPGNGVSRG